jgi:hypothetical protein
LQNRILDQFKSQRQINRFRILHGRLVEEGKSEREIALALNQRAILSDFGRPWTRFNPPDFDERKIYRQQHFQSRVLQIEATPRRDRL